MKFRKKPIVIEAVQWNRLGDHPAVRAAHYADPDDTNPAIGEIDTLEGTLTVQRGDWIITGVKGEVYACKPDIFALTYEPEQESKSGSGLLDTVRLARCYLRNLPADVVATGCIREAIETLDAALTEGNKPELSERCGWNSDDDGAWHAGCGGIFCLDDGTPAENDMRFCCYCSKPITEGRLYAEPDAEDEADVSLQERGPESSSAETSQHNHERKAP